MGNNPNNCQQCQFRQPEPNNNNPQHTHTNKTSHTPQSYIQTEKLRSVNQPAKGYNHSYLVQPDTHNHSFVTHHKTMSATQPIVQFAHNPPTPNRRDIRFEQNGQFPSTPQRSQHQHQFSDHSLRRQTVISQIKSQDRIIMQPPTTLARSPSAKQVTTHSNKIVFNYNNQQPQHVTRVPITNQPNLSPVRLNQGIVFSSQAINTKPAQRPVQSFPQPVLFPQTTTQQQINALNIFFPTNSANIPTSQVTELVFSQQSSSKQIKLIKIGTRQILESQVDPQDTFLTHHLKYELSLTKYANMKRIRRRQIMEHLWLQSQWQNHYIPRDLKIKFGSFGQSIIYAWIQRTFLDIWQQAHTDFFLKHLDYKFVRYKVAQQYMHQLFQFKQFADSSAANLNFMFCSTSHDLNTFLQFSDDSLLHLFRKLKDRYPQTSSKETIQFPDVPTTKTSINILDHFPALSFSDPNNLNYQTIYEDINFLLNKAMEEQDTFKQDMKDILGADVLGCTKVGQVNKDGKSFFNACAVRRVFVKWAENILQKCPDLFESKSFMRFVQTRGKIANNFIFKSSVQDSTHKFVIDCVSLLLQAAKFNLKDNDLEKREEFIFNIYDLLRCKIKRGTPTEIVDLLERMKSTSITKNGKKFEVIRVKNRFNTNNRDLLINFRYGDVLIGEAQLCVDNSSQMNKQAKLNYDFCHYIYELERSIFGPTLQLMMEYEDYQRPDITVTFEAEDVVQGRKNQKIQKLENINRKCIQGHKMVSIVGNVVFSQDEEDEEEQDDTMITCDYCDTKYPATRRYDYCYLCGCMLCTDCRETYEKANKKAFHLSVENKHNITQINSQQQLQDLCQKNGSMIVLFWLQNSSPSEVLRDGLIYQQSKQIMQPNKYIPRTGLVKYSTDQSVQSIIAKYKVNQFPTLILFDSKASAARAVIGCSWFQVTVFYALQQKMVEQHSAPVTKVYCIDYSCKKEMLLDDLTGKKELVCQSCFSHSQFYHFPQQYRNKGFFCEGNHYQCISCCYVNFEFPTVHQDFMGQSYLSSNFIKPVIQKCSQGHNVQITYQSYPSQYVFKCFGCKKQRYVDNQYGVGQCKSCIIRFCSSCLGARQPSFEQLQNRFQLVSHSVQSTAEDSYFCVCKRFFKKTYLKRYLTRDQFIKADPKTATWKCKLCKNEYKEGQLHIACFCCPQLYDEQSGQSAHFQICYACANKSKIIRNTTSKKQKEQDSYFICPEDHHSLVFTSFAYNKQLTFNCFFCEKRFYRNSARFYCKQCSLNVCKDCRDQLEKQHFQPPSCPQTCPNNHSLQFQFVKQAKQLQFCDGCMCTLIDEKYTCDQDNYSLCLSCTKNNPANFKGTMLSRVRELTDTLVGFFKKEIFAANQPTQPQNK